MHVVQERVNTGVMRRSNESPAGSSNVAISSDSSIVMIGVQVTVFYMKFTDALMKYAGTVQGQCRDSAGTVQVQPNQVLIYVQHAIIVCGGHFIQWRQGGVGTERRRLAKELSSLTTT